MATYEGYCVKCKEKRQFEGEEVTLANGRPAAQGTCPVCGTKMNRMLASKSRPASAPADREWAPSGALGSLQMRYWLETLGCPKNQVDSDKLAGRLVVEGYEEARSPDSADLVVVNTCAFIEAARQESIETVLALAGARRPGARLVVTGCMAERYGQELADALPEVDLVAGFGIPVTLTPKPVPGRTFRSPLRPAQPASPSRIGALGVCEGG